MYILISLEEESDFDDIYEPLVEDQQQDNLDDEEIDQGEISNEETQDVPITTSWSSNARDLSKEPEIHAFTGERKVGEDIEGNSTLFDIFKLFITQALLRSLKQQTNIYAAQEIAKAKQENRDKSNSIFSKWKMLTLVELKKFLAIIFHMSLMNKPKLSDYWTISPVVTAPFAKSLMSRDRFLAILSFLHVNDNTNYIGKGQPLHVQSKACN